MKQGGLGQQQRKKLQKKLKRRDSRTQKPVNKIRK
jgi:hypothetical protein